MRDTAYFVEKLRAKIGAEQGKSALQVTNYAIAKYTGNTETTVGRWAKGKGSFSDETAIQFAMILNLDSAYVVACIHAERTKSDTERALWTRIANMTAGLAALLVFAVYGGKRPAQCNDNSHRICSECVHLSHHVYFFVIIHLSLTLALSTGCERSPESSPNVRGFAFVARRTCRLLACRWLLPPLW